MKVRERKSGVGAVVITAATVALVALDVTDESIRRWWDGHALTSDTVAGLLVLLVTVLVVDEVVGRRQAVERERAVAAQAAIVVAQAARSARAVIGALDGSGQRDNAANELRTYLMMLLVSAPVLIDAQISRTFLEQAQRLGGEMARVVTSLGSGSDATPVSRAGLDDAVQQLRTAATPLLSVLRSEEWIAAAADLAG